MRKLANILWTEPVAVLAIVTGVTAVLAQQHLLPGWVPLIVLAIVTPLQRAAVTAGVKLKKLTPRTRKELDI